MYGYWIIRLCYIDSVTCQLYLSEPGKKTTKLLPWNYILGNWNLLNKHTNSYSWFHWCFLFFWLNLYILPPQKSNSWIPLCILMLLFFYLLFDIIFNLFLLLFCCTNFSGSQSDIRWHQIHRSPQNLLFPAVGTEDTLSPLWFSVSFIFPQEDVRTHGLPCVSGSFLHISLHLPLTLSPTAGCRLMIYSHRLWVGVQKGHALPFLTLDQART